MMRFPCRRADNRAFEGAQRDVLLDTVNDAGIRRDKPMGIIEVQNIIKTGFSDIGLTRTARPHA